MMCTNHWQDGKAIITRFQVLKKSKRFSEQQAFGNESYMNYDYYYNEQYNPDASFNNYNYDQFNPMPQQQQQYIPQNQAYNNNNQYSMQNNVQPYQYPNYSPPIKQDYSPNNSNSNNTCYQNNYDYQYSNDYYNAAHNTNPSPNHVYQGKYNYGYSSQNNHYYQHNEYPQAYNNQYNYNYGYPYHVEANQTGGITYDYKQTYTPNEAIYMTHFDKKYEDRNNWSTIDKTKDGLCNNKNESLSLSDQDTLCDEFAKLRISKKDF